MSDHSDLEFEPIVGLPEELPEGETIVWQGRPQWKALARETYKTRWLAAYFGLFVIGRGVLALRGGEGAEGAFSVLSMALLSLGCLALLSVLAWLQARATVYTITTERVVLRIGVALPMTWNLPFSRLQSADLVEREGNGDVVMSLTPPDKVAWLFLWPHAAPWQARRPKPALRAIPDAKVAAEHLREVVNAWSAEHADRPIEVHESAPAAEEMMVVGPRLAPEP